MNRYPMCLLLMVVLLAQLPALAQELPLDAPTMGDEGTEETTARGTIEPPPADPKSEADSKPSGEKSKAFAGSDLLVGRSVKQPTGAKRFAIGLNVQFAPMNMVLGSQRDLLLDQTIAGACGSNAECKSAADENLDDALEAIAEIPDDQWNDLVTAATDKNAMQSQLNEMVAAGALSPTEAQAVSGMAGELPDGQLGDVLTGTRLLARQEATSVLVEPNMELNFSAISLNLRLPIAMVMFDSETKWNLGNLTLDLKFGYTFGSSAAAFGLGYGLSLYTPTGTPEAGAMALADLWFGPKFMHGYGAAAPFFVMGFDSYVLSLQAHGELVSQHHLFGGDDAKTAPPTHVLYGKYGAGLVILPHWPVSLIGEVNGLAPIVDAGPYDALFGIAGAQLELFFLKAALAVQMPIIAPAPKELGSIGGVSMGELASYSLIGRAAFCF